MQRDKQPNLTNALSSGHRTDPPSPMLRELQRWTGSTRVKTVPSRWTDWARSMIGRHGPVVGLRGTQSMTLVRTAMPIHLHERLMSFSFNAYSRINLAIQPILREIRMGNAKAASARGGQADGSRGWPRSDADTTALRPTAFINETGAVLPVVAGRAPTAEPSSNTHAIQTGRARPTASTAGNYQSARIESAPAGVSLAFRRLHQGDEFGGSRHRSETINEDAGEHALRLVKQLQRVEQAMSGVTAEVARRLPNPASQHAAPQVLAAEHTAHQTLGMFKASEQFWRSNAPQMPDVIVEQLTERVIREIDQRTIAWRERMGKIR